MDDTQISPWYFNEMPFTEEMINGYYGFVYCITNLINGKRYIGRKYFYTNRKRKGKRRRVRESSDWKNYWGSSKFFQSEVEKYGKENFKREILSLHKTKGDTNYFENYILFNFNVLESRDSKNERKYYNDNIMSRYFYKNIEKMAESRVLSNFLKKTINKS